jgi:GT2 family glycosyltransferase
LSHALSGVDMRAGEPELSVVITYFNEGPLLHRAIASVIDEPCEIVVVDDCSTVPWPDFPAAWQGRVRTAQTPRNSYAGAARNLGVSLVRGSHVAFLDADDVFLPERLSSHREFLQRHPGTVVVGSPVQICRDGDEWVEFPPILRRTIPGITLEAQLLPEEVRWLVCDDYCFNTGGMTVDVDHFRSVGGFDESLRWGEEWDLLVRLAQRGRLGFVPVVGCRYLNRPNSITSTVNPWKFDSMARINRRIRQLVPGLPSDIRGRAKSREHEAWLLACQEFLEVRNDAANARRCAMESWKTGPSVWSLRSTVRASIWTLLSAKPKSLSGWAATKVTS